MAYVDQNDEYKKLADDSRAKVEDYMRQAFNAKESKALREDCFKFAEIWADVYRSDVLRGG